MATVDELLQFSEDVDKDRADMFKRYPLLLAAMGGHDKVCIKLIEAGAKVEGADQDGRSCIHYAALSGLSDSLSKMLEKSGNDGDVVNLQDRNGATAVLHACRSVRPVFLARTMERCSRSVPLRILELCFRL